MKLPSRRLSWCLGALALGALGIFSCLGNLRQAQLPIIVAEAGEALPLVEEVYDFELAPGSWRELDGTRIHVYNVELRTGDVLQAYAEQEKGGLDVDIGLYGPDGRALVTVDSRFLIDEVFFVARVGGVHKAKVTWVNRSGWYRLYREPLRQAVNDDVTRSAREEKFHRARILAQSRASKEAIRLYQEVAEFWQRLGEVERLADTYQRIGDEYLEGEAYSNALVPFEKAIDILKDTTDWPNIARVHNQLGRCYKALGDLPTAESHYYLALEFARRYSLVNEEAYALNNLSRILEQRGEPEEALEFLNQALRLAESSGDAEAQASILGNMGHFFVSLDLPEQALKAYKKVHGLLGEGGNQEILAAALDGSARAYVQLERYEEAVTLLKEALALRRGDPKEAVTLSSLGWVYLDQKDFSQARRYFDDAWTLFKESEDTRAQATALLNLGTLHLIMRHPVQALDYYGQALPIAERAGYRDAQAIILRGIAEAQALLGNSNLAQKLMWQALQIVESVRDHADRRDLQVNILASKHSFFEFFIDLLMDKGDSAQALVISERSRARSLLDSIASQSSSRDMLSYLARPKPLSSLKEVQEQLDQETVLLEYYLGDDQSYLFVVTVDRLEVFFLDGIDEINSLARKLHGSTSGPLRGQKGGVDEALEELSRILLEPAAHLIEGKRLLIVPHERLQSIPFAILPDPPLGQFRRRWLVQGHEIVYASSVSVLAELRRRKGLRTTTPEGIAIFADPVFEEDDDRLAGTRARYESRASQRSEDDLSRLKHTRSEAQAIQNLAGEERILRVEGFAVNHERVTRSDLGSYRILHFATHGVLSETEGGSGIELSRYNAQGERTTRESLRTSDIEGLNFTADLVVLSACSTALGKEFKGEGMMGLPHSFLYAGAAGVLVSLWNVDDKATAELMKRFYHGLLQKNLQPAKALYEAQRSMSQESDWDDPFYWGGFILQGDWR